MNLNQVTIPVRNLATSVDFYEKLGLLLIVHASVLQGCATIVISVALGEVGLRYETHRDCYLDKWHASLDDVAVRLLQTLQKVVVLRCIVLVGRSAAATL